MFERLRKMLESVTPEPRKTSYAPGDAIHIGPPMGDPPRTYMSVWLEKYTPANSTKEHARIALEFRNAPGWVTRFDTKALPELIAALATIHAELQKEANANVSNH